MKLAAADSLPPPNELGAPDRFTGWRREQVDALMRITGTDKRFICMNMPTGSGKSLVGSMAGRLLGGRTLILTATKILQDQIVKDRLVDLDVRGQQNYECLAVNRFGPLAEYANRYNARTMVDRAPCHVGVHCWMKFGGCTYYDRVRDVRESNGIVSTNYSYWLALGKSIRDGRTDETLGKFDLIVCDEAHSAVNEVCSALRIELPVAEMQGLLNLKPLNNDASVEAWKSWAEAALMGWGEEMDRVSRSLRGQYIDPDIVDEYKTLQQMGTSLEQVADLSGDWVVGQSWKGTNVTFDPVWPTDYTEQLLFRDVPKILFTSATINQKTLDVLGVPKEREFVEYPSSFPVSRRPVYIMADKSVPRVDFRMTEESELLWIGLIDAFIGKRIERNRKGIIHCVSYARMERIKRLSKYRELFITNADSSKTRDSVERYKKSKMAVLLSPSVTTGEDFPDDECRWIVIPKLPFSDSRDPIAKKREQADKGYGGSTMMITLAQSVGRGPRSSTDWCESIIIDGHALWAMPKFQVHAPMSFRSSWKWVYALPELLEV